MPKKTPKDTERNDRRDALEVLRDECAHSHDDVGLRQCRTIPQGEEKDEGPEFVADADADERKVKALLKRLGDILETWSEGFKLLGQVAPPASEWQRSRLIAAQVLLDRCEWKKITETGSTFLADGEEFPEPWPIDSTTSQRVVPNIRLAIAEVCLVLLRDKQSVATRKRQTVAELWSKAYVALIEEFERSRELLTDKQVATRIGITNTHFSRQVVGKSAPKHEAWKNLRANHRFDRRGKSL